MSLEGVRWLRVSWKGHSFVILIGMKEGKCCVEMDSGVIYGWKLDSWPAVWGRTRWRYDRSSQSPWTWVEAWTIPMRGGYRSSLMMATHTSMSVFSDNKCWMIYPRLIPCCKQTTCTVLPFPCRSAQPTSSICPRVYCPNPLRGRILFCPMLPALQNKNGFCLIDHKLRQLFLM